MRLRVHSRQINVSLAKFTFFVFFLLEKTKVGIFTAGHLSEDSIYCRVLHKIARVTSLYGVTAKKN